MSPGLLYTGTAWVLGSSVIYPVGDQERKRIGHCGYTTVDRTDISLMISATISLARTGGWAGRKKGEGGERARNFPLIQPAVLCSLRALRTEFRQVIDLYRFLIDGLLVSLPFVFPVLYEFRARNAVLSATDVTHTPL